MGTTSVPIGGIFLHSARQKTKLSNFHTQSLWRA